MRLADPPHADYRTRPAVYTYACLTAEQRGETDAKTVDDPNRERGMSDAAEVTEA